MIPAFDPTTNALPAGIHEATWGEFVARFGITAQRQALLAGMTKALAWVVRAGGTRVYIGGSFVTAKADPGDWDGCVEIETVDVDQLSAAILNEDRVAMHEIYGGELFLADDEIDFVNFFQRTRRRQAIGIVALIISEEDMG